MKTKVTVPCVATITSTVRVLGGAVLVHRSSGLWGADGFKSGSWVEMRGHAQPGNNGYGKVLVVDEDTLTIQRERFTGSPVDEGPTQGVTVTQGTTLDDNWGTILEMDYGFRDIDS